MHLLQQKAARVNRKMLFFPESKGSLCHGFVRLSFFPPWLEQTGSLHQASFTQWAASSVTEQSAPLNLREQP